jgi:hypothetical protein
MYEQTLIGFKGAARKERIILGRGVKSMPETKRYTIEFHVGQVGADGRAGRVSDLLRQIAQGQAATVFRRNELTYEVRELTSHHNGASFSGVLAKFRTDDFPHVGEPGGPEHPLDIEENEGLIEKNHFLYFRQRELLVWQRNRNGSSSSRLADCLSDVANETVVLNPVYQPEAVRRLMRGGVRPLALEFSVARPTNPELLPRNQWSNALMRVMNEAGGARFYMRITSDQRSTDRERQSLSNRIKAAARELADMEGVNVLRFRVDDGGIEHPLDLIEDRIVSRQDVEMEGRYPISHSMFSALRNAREEQQAALNEYFGLENALA